MLAAVAGGTAAGAALLAALAFPAALPAQEAVAQSAIRLGHLRPSVPNNSSLSGECRPGASGELVCDFVWTWLEYRVDPGDLEAQTARQIARVRQEIVSQGLTRYLEQLCYPAEEIDDYKFRLPERTRREIFAQLAAAELAERARAIQANTWKGHTWSREDDRGHYERVAALGGL